MDDLVALRKLVPELDEVVERRYSLLKIVRNEAPIGRRFLAALLGSSGGLPALNWRFCGSKV